jgi:hypothetical protein
MIQISKTGLGPKKQIASMGCSIKWRENVWRRTLDKGSWWRG